MSNPIPPHAPSDVSTMFALWVAARAQIDIARVLRQSGQAADYQDTLRLGAAISREVLADRWPDVAELLRLGAVESWAQLGETLGMTETDARDGFHAWVGEQVQLFERTGTLGMSPADAETLRDLAERTPL